MLGIIPAFAHRRAAGSRRSIVESAARVCGIDDVVLRLRHCGNMSVTRAHFGSMPLGRVEVSFDGATLSVGYASMVRSTFPMSRPAQKRFFPDALGLLAARVAHVLFWPLPFCQQGELIGTLNAQSRRSASLYPGADQAARNLCRSGSYRHRERAVIQGAQGMVFTWSSRLRRVRFLVSLQARRRTSQPVLDAIAQSAGSGVRFR